MKGKTAAERPILFNGPMVKAIMDGRKTQTRRIIKPQPSSGVRVSPFVKSGIEDRHGRELRCPHGQPGDRLWVRESFAFVPRTAYLASEGVHQVIRPDDDHDAAVFRAGWDRSAPARWRPSIHMPRWACRLVLQITGVRVERLQDISPDDCIAEGAWFAEDKALGRGSEAIAAYRALWESINGEGSWEQNPWVWVIEFKAI